ncbi:peptidoglycan/xylan/chitin deacetylase (PgdA/CDA1 family) [Lewinella aquimaris]|uniref:Peptidoglycan/xylan/chitin deacetylase (PgdA/CDA1 family) n=1 Tax=Neolewinella aquimaris TaxID=1835722 RepID=A0A840EHX3_9BACT|nr:polysaccharide deacetylase family protein [Neolewinella aquimaris]MBB4080496.1 peptidoglycan/xylan/chitin deacetylase (PgdA/CDA1 family) [Neolewinella aquimaris]
MKNLIFQLLDRSGLVRLFRALKQRRAVTILLFHDPSPAAMEMALAYLTENYRIISLATYLEARKTGTTEGLPDYAAVITFDDGHKGNYALLPVFKKYGVPATVFLCSAIVDTQRHFWFLEAEGQLPVEELKGLSNQERLDRLSEIGFEEQKEYATRQALSAQEIGEMRPLIDFQSHTRFHPILTNCRQARVRTTLQGAKQKLEEQFGLSIYALAYPNGDYDATTIEETRNAGYRCGLTVDHGFNDDTTDLYRLRRLDVNDTCNIHELVVKSSGLWQHLKALRRS